MDMAGLTQNLGLWLGVATAVMALFLAFRHKLTWTSLVFASGVGFAVALGWIAHGRWPKWRSTRST